MPSSVQFTPPESLLGLIWTSRALDDAPQTERIRNHIDQSDEKVRFGAIRLWPEIQSNLRQHAGT